MKWPQPAFGNPDEISKIVIQIVWVCSGEGGDRLK